MIRKLLVFALLLAAGFAALHFGWLAWVGLLAGIALYAISYDDPTVLAEFSDKQRIPYPLLSDIDSKYRRNENAQAFHAARSEALAYQIAKDGVDTDTEMQKLLLIEQAYAANARVIQTVDELMQQLLEL